MEKLFRNPAVIMGLLGLMVVCGCALQELEELEIPEPPEPPAVTQLTGTVVDDAGAPVSGAKVNLIKAADLILAMGPKVLIVKKGESGSLMCSSDGERFILPAYPASKAKDPTGAGDSFAGGLMGYLAQRGKTDFESLRTAIAYGTVIASFAISDFSLDGLNSVAKADIDKRLKTLRKLTQF